MLETAEAARLAAEIQHDMANQYEDVSSFSTPGSRRALSMTNASSSTHGSPGRRSARERNLRSFAGGSNLCASFSNEAGASTRAPASRRGTPRSSGPVSTTRRASNPAANQQPRLVLPELNFRIDSDAQPDQSSGKERPASVPPPMVDTGTNGPTVQYLRQAFELNTHAQVCSTEAQSNAELRAQ